MTIISTFITHIEIHVIFINLKILESIKKEWRKSRALILIEISLSIPSSGTSTLMNAHAHVIKVLNQASNERWSFSDRHSLGTLLSAAPSIVLSSRSASSRGMLINPLIIKLIAGLIGSRKARPYSARSWC